MAELVKDRTMCIGVPAQIVELKSDENALANMCGVLREIDLSLVDPTGVGQWVLVHVGSAMSIINESEARETLEILQRMFGLEPDVGTLINGERED